MKMIFMGTPLFAAQTFESLLQKNPFAAVVTQPDRPQGRGLTLTPSPVKVLAQKAGIEILQPEKTKDPLFIQRIKEIAPDLIIVVAYGGLLKEEIIAIPPLGCMNLHSSLLPRYRGATPVQWALMNGEKETGWTTFYIDEGMDSGDMILQNKILIRPDEDAQTLFQRMAPLGIDLLQETLTLVQQGKAPRIKQDPAKVSLAPRLQKRDGVIQWTASACEIANRVRGLIPWPVAATHLEWKGKRQELKIFKAAASTSSSSQPGKILETTTNEIRVGTGDGSLLVQEVQLEGSKRMNVQDFLRGHALPIGMMLG